MHWNTSHTIYLDHACTLVNLSLYILRALLHKLLEKFFHSEYSLEMMKMYIAGERLQDLMFLNLYISISIASAMWY